jgi:hypothetical protein
VSTSVRGIGTPSGACVPHDVPHFTHVHPGSQSGQYDVARA